MNKIVFGYKGISDKSVGGGIAKLEDLGIIVGELDVYELRGTKRIGDYISLSDEKELIDQWIFGDTKSIDTVILQLNKLKELMIKEKKMKTGDACYIFRNIDKLDELSIDGEPCQTWDALEAIDQVANMETHNSFTKAEMLAVIKWLLDYVG